MRSVSWYCYRLSSMCMHALSQPSDNHLFLNSIMGSLHSLLNQISNHVTDTLSFQFWHQAIDWQWDLPVRNSEEQRSSWSVEMQRPIITSGCWIPQDGMCLHACCVSAPLWGLWKLVLLCVHERTTAPFLCTKVRPFIDIWCMFTTNFCVMFASKCVQTPLPQQQHIRSICNGTTKVRVFRWLGCSSGLCLKVTTPHQRIISLPFHTSLSVWSIFKNETARPLRKHRRGEGEAASGALRLLDWKRDVCTSCLWWWQWWAFTGGWVCCCFCNVCRWENQTSHQTGRCVCVALGKWTALS